MHKLIKKIFKTRILVGYGLFLGLILYSTPLYAAQPYQQGAYGDCAYSIGCNPDVPSTVVEVPPSTANPQTGRAFAVNIKHGQTFKGMFYTVVITPNFSVEQINLVELYQNGELVGSSSTPDGSIYEIIWQLPKENKYSLGIVMRLKDGSVIEQNFQVSVASPHEVNKFNSNNRQPDVSDISHPEKGLTFFGSIGSMLRSFAQTVPRPVAYALPYMLFVLLSSLLLVLLYQTRNQLAYIAGLLKLLERDKQLTDEKANFIMLASHYIRTPLTILGGSIDLSLMESSDDVQLLQAKSTVNNLHTRAEQILNDVEQNKDLSAIRVPNMQAARSSLYKSFSLIAPIILSVLIVAAINLIFLWARRIEFIVPNLLIQLLLLSVLSIFLYSLLKRRSQQLEQKQKVKQQREYELQLDIARNQFIKQSAKQLTPLVNQLKSDFNQSPKLTKSPQITAALNQLEALIYRFVLVTELERGKIEKSLSQFNIEQVAEGIVAEFEPNINTKKLQLIKRLKQLQVHQSQPLLQYVLRILLDNAIKFTPITGKLRFEAAALGKKHAVVTIKNYGQAIDPAKLERLFQPFSRSETAEVATEGGAGLSLYLARLIMRYLGGNVDLDSDAVKVTTAKVVLPRNGETTSSVASE